MQLTTRLPASEWGEYYVGEAQETGGGLGVVCDLLRAVLTEAHDWLNYSGIFLKVCSLIILGPPHEDVVNLLMWE